MEPSENSNTKNCPFCGEEIEPNASRCPHCNENILKTCPFCGEEIKASAIKCKHCGEFLENKSQINSDETRLNKLPIECQKFNWGAFYFGWFWGVCNCTWFPLWIEVINAIIMTVLYLTCIPALFASTNEEDMGIIVIILVLGSILDAIFLLGFRIWLGVNGNELALNNKYWKNIEHFNKNQRMWGMWAGIVWILSIILSIFYGIIFAVITET